MRTDYVEQLNAALESQAIYLDQVIWMHEAEIQKLKSTARALRSLASKEAAEGDPIIDGKPFAPPSIFQRPGIALTSTKSAVAPLSSSEAERAVSAALAPKQAAE